MVPNTFTDDEINTSRLFIIGNVHKNSMIVSSSLRGNPYTTYQSLVRNIGYDIESEFDGYNAGILAGKINEFEDKVTGLLLSAVVVDQENMRPGRGFFTLAQSMGFLNVEEVDPDGIEELSFWTEQVRRIVRIYGKQVGRLLL